jgi:hypothetical protein
VTEIVALGNLGLKLPCLLTFEAERSPSSLFTKRGQRLDMMYKNQNVSITFEQIVYHDISLVIIYFRWHPSLETYNFPVVKVTMIEIFCSTAKAIFS